MENTSKERKAISRRERAFNRRRNQNRLHAALAGFFAEEAEAGRITKKQLADLIERNPAQITRWLTDPSNYEADTISDLLLAMGAEMDYRVCRFSERAAQNYLHPMVRQILKPSAVEPTTKYEPLLRPESNTTVATNKAA